MKLIYAILLISFTSAHADQYDDYVSTCAMAAIETGDFDSWNWWRHLADDPETISLLWDKFSSLISTLEDEAQITLIEELISSINISCDTIRTEIK